MLKLPPIAAKLHAAYTLLEAMNEHLQVEDFYFSEEEAELDVLLPGENQPQSAVCDLSMSLLMAAFQLLPENYSIGIRDKKMVIVWCGPMTGEDDAGEGPSTFHRVPFAYRFAPEARTAYARDGEPVAGFAILQYWCAKGETISDSKCAEINRYYIADFARRCGCEEKHITPISVEEYVAAGNSLEDV